MSPRHPHLARRNVPAGFSGSEVCRIKTPNPQLSQTLQICKILFNEGSDNLMTDSPDYFCSLAINRNTPKKCSTTRTRALARRIIRPLTAVMTGSEPCEANSKICAGKVV
jgi:hypothetical protein